MITVGIVGGAGYTGGELLRLLWMHKEVDVKVITSREYAGRRVEEIHRHLSGTYGHLFVNPDISVLDNLDLVFFATPHGVSMHLVPELLEKSVRVIDLSPDYRLQDSSIWKRWYGEDHASPDLLGEAIYGLPELNREDILGARLIACPGCYPTAVGLGLAPLLSQDVIDPSNLIVSAASGVSGAGKSASLANNFSEIGESFKSYGVHGHRHLPEIEQTLTKIAGNKVKVTFVPHLLPIVRGIHATLFASLNDTNVCLQTLFEDFYVNEKFVEILPQGLYPATRTVKGSNRVQISLIRPLEGDIIVVLVVEDNLVKGASGQAIQCMNILFRLPEEMGLHKPGLVP